MIFFGNDIIDLNDKDSFEPDENPRFLKRVFTQNELVAISNSENPKVTLWLLWAIKESAYKAIKRKYLQAQFIPKEFLVNLEKEQVFWQEKVCLYYGIEREKNYLASYCLSAMDPKLKIHHWCERSDLNTSLSPSQAVRNLAKIKLSLLWNIAQEEIQIDYFLPPRIINKKTQQTLPISMSHHGQFVSVLFVENF